MSASISDQAYTRRRLAWNDSRRSMKFIVRRPLKVPPLRRAAPFHRIVGKLRGEEDVLDQEGAATTSDAAKGSAKDSRGAKGGTATGKVAVDEFVVVTIAPHRTCTVACSFPRPHLGVWSWRRYYSYVFCRSFSRRIDETESRVMHFWLAKCDANPVKLFPA